MVTEKVNSTYKIGDLEVNRLGFGGMQLTGKGVWGEVPNRENGLKVLTQLPCYSLHMNYRALTKKRVELIKQSNIKLFAYTVNRRRLARRLLDWGVDALFSDYPDLIA